MRLTLRTLLAYLDGILYPADAEELRQKIEDSDFAKGLVHRIRSASIRSRLGAPGIDGRGMGLDPNTVAEYLDNLLPPDRVPDLERVCLESDVHLAEVASCHQILTIVLGEPAQVDPDLRERMYQLGAPQTERRAATAIPPAEVTMSPLASSSGAVSAPPLAGQGFEPPPVPLTPPPVESPPGSAVEPARRTRGEVPEYLRAGQRSNWKPLAITLLLAFLLSAVALRAMGPFSRNHPLLRLFGGGGSSEVAEAESSGPPLAGQGESVDGQEAQDGQRPETAPRQPADDSTAGRVEPVLDADQTAQPGGVEGETSDTAAKRQADDISPDGTGAETGNEKAGNGKTEVEFPATEPAVHGDPAEAAPGEKPKPAAEKSVPEGQPGPLAPVEVGYVKIKDLHFPVRLDPASQDWYRLPARSKLFSGDHLRVLPTFRPEIVLAPGVQVVFAGPSSVHLTPPTPQGEPTLLVEYGRAFVATAGVPGARINLNVGGRSCVVTFMDAASEIALEVRKFLPPGAHPERDVAQQVVRVFTTVGRIQWQDDGQAAPVPVVEGQVRVIVEGTAETVAAGDVPPWILREDVREIDRAASTALESFITVERPVTLSLKERVEDRRTEMRALAAMCLSYLGHYDALVAELDDTRQRAHWAAEFDTLRAAISRSPESAAAVRTSLESLYPNIAVEAYRLLSAYSPQQLQEGADESLVRMLEHDSLCIRVLASENLRRITGMTLSYFPYATEGQRRTSIRGWRERLDNRAILYDTLPSPTSGGW